ncbi:MAG: hypothetical protein ACI38A_06170 [Candidatus Ornithomonoglobus sp.]
MNRKEYKAPAMEIRSFMVESVITGSGSGGDTPSTLRRNGVNVGSVSANEL